MPGLLACSFAVDGSPDQRCGYRVFYEPVDGASLVEANVFVDFSIAYCQVGLAPPRECQVVYRYDNPAEVACRPGYQLYRPADGSAVACVSDWRPATDFYPPGAAN